MEKKDHTHTHTHSTAELENTLPSDLVDCKFYLVCVCVCVCQDPTAGEEECAFEAVGGSDSDHHLPPLPAEEVP